MKTPPQEEVGEVSKYILDCIPGTQGGLWSDSTFVCVEEEDSVPLRFSSLFLTA